MERRLIPRRSALRSLLGIVAGCAVGSSRADQVRVRAPLRIGYFGDSTAHTAVWIPPTSTAPGYYAYPSPHVAETAADTAGQTQAVVVVEHAYDGARTDNLINGTTTPSGVPTESLETLLMRTRYDIVILNFGINDALMTGPSRDLAAFHANLATLRETASFFGAIVMIEQPNPIEILPGSPNFFSLDSAKIGRLNDYIANPLDASAYPYHYIDHGYTNPSNPYIHALSDDLHPTPAHYLYRGQQVGQAIAAIVSSYYWRRKGISVFL